MMIRSHVFLTLALALSCGPLAFADLEPLTDKEILENIEAGAGCSFDKEGQTFAYADTQYLVVKSDGDVVKLSPLREHAFYGNSKLKPLVMPYAASDSRIPVEILNVTENQNGKFDVEFVEPAVPGKVTGLQRNCGD